MTAKLSLTSCLLVLIMTLTSSAVANTLGPLSGLLIEGKDGSWIGAFQQGSYWLENPAERGAIQYFYAPYQEGTGGKRKYSIDVDVSNTTAVARAGILYGLQNNPTRYFMILVGRGGQVEVYKRDANGVNQMIASTVQVKPGFNRVEIREDGRSVE